MIIRNHELDTNNKTYICGIINVTPDSFSDAGKNLQLETALKNALKMISEGASIIDIGGESTRPGFTPVSEEEEENRVIPLVKALRAQSDILISVDTVKASVAKKAIEAGADIINDISGLLADPMMVSVIKEANVACIISHNENYVNRLVGDKSAEYEYKTETENSYVNQDYVNQICTEMKLLAKRAMELGIPKDKIMLDPGVGFKGSAEIDHLVLNNLMQIVKIGFPVFLGVSRKSCIASVCGESIREREAGTVAISALSTLAGVAVIRVHNVKENACAVRITEEICKYG